jgi:Cu+-exporting ATPase
MILPCIESGSEHPLAQVIVDSTIEKGIDPENVTDFHAIAGHGVKAVFNDHKLLFGNQKLMSKYGVALNDFVSQAQQLAAEAKTPMYLAIDNKLAAIIAVSDPIKNDSIEAIKRLQANGIRVVMLTGDNKATAKAVAKKVGITEVFAEVLPEDKANKVAELQAQGEIVGMTGDGINDAPA